ncbi:Reductase [Caballeronia glathei]|jgi:NAD(P)-dependent dehydrogenase (short-subunit alcohol dehydrogenase family)|uniref:Short-chain dehydrogenase n=1 Tax=Caballeronia glathei TaxID=60547 RepID=A0A069PUU5_9BURK|nr:MULTISPECIES: SDR family oxidoreductase [Burkholderiaceae]KDR43609.1 short-chain dehydrogenase [Caballeronia glathei]TCK43751.1 NAD(P)-dependent dehydrogenase (short-subunit alcohol dehydrogenase family) [Paraburkholderia sp. BL8N3]CDY75482.1 Reductase [Caballeronia glathei]
MNGKIAVITGASRGLGRNMALKLGARGVGIIATYNRSAAGADSLVSDIAAAGGKAAALKLDVAKSETFAAFADDVGKTLHNQFGRENFDFLVNNAGIGIYATFADTTPAQFDELVNIQLKGPFFLTQALLPLISEEGRIVNISTGVTRFTLPGFSAYAAMKGGIEVLTRYLAKELGPHGIVVNTLAPGAIETDFGGGVVRDDHDTNQFLASNTALGRVGMPDDIGDAIAALLSDDNRWITGQRIEVSGGMFL